MAIMKKVKVEVSPNAKLPYEPRGGAAKIEIADGIVMILPDNLNSKAQPNQDMGTIKDNAGREYPCWTHSAPELDSKGQKTSIWGPVIYEGTIEEIRAAAEHKRRQWLAMPPVVRARCYPSR